MADLESAESEESIPWGYPEYASLLGRHANYQNFRRFRILRMRVLLQKQDKIVEQESRLERLDAHETNQINLSSFRRDVSEDRNTLLSQIDIAIKEYDECLQRAYWVINADDPIERDMESLQNWHVQKPFIKREEREYVNQHPRELLSVGYVKDKKLSFIARIIERITLSVLYTWNRILWGKRGKNYDNNDNIEVPRQPIRRIARAIAAVATVVILLVPIIILNIIHRALYRYVVVFLATSIFVLVVTLTSDSGMAEIFAAGAGYAAVLVVFVSGNGF